MDPSVWGVIGGFAIAAVTAAAGVVTAVINNRRERGSAAEDAMEETLRERIILRDEQLQVKDHEIEKLKENLRLCEEGRQS